MTSNDGDAWAAFPHDQARSRAYRWVSPHLITSYLLGRRWHRWIL